MQFNDFQQGDRGQGVKDLQTNLKKVGYPLSVDGAFGPMTAAAVQHFQERQHVVGDTAGVAGPGTLIALSQAVMYGWRQTDFIYLGTPVVRTVTPTPSAPGARAGIGLPFGLTTGKLAIVGLIGAVAYATSRR